jgi:hypothetical protein
MKLFNINLNTKDLNFFQTIYYFYLTFLLKYKLNKLSKEQILEITKNYKGFSVEFKDNKNMKES